MPKCIVKRDAKGRFAGCMPGTGGGSGGGGGGKKSGSGGGLAGGLPDNVDDLQAIAKKEGIDIDTLSHKARKSTLAAAINAKRAGKDLREEGLLKSTKSKMKPPGVVVGKGSKKKAPIALGDHTAIAKVGSDFVKSKVGDLDKLAKSLESLNVEAGKLTDDFLTAQKKGVNTKPFVDKLMTFNKKKEALYDKQDKAFESLRGEIYKATPLTKAEATALAKQADFSGIKGKADRVAAENLLGDYYHFTGGQGSSTIKTVEAKADRAHAIIDQGYVDLGKPMKPAIAWHEFAHHGETENAGLLAANYRWRLDKAKASGSSKLESMSDLTGSKLFDASEVGVRGKFIDPYVGKVYDPAVKATEVYSMGIEKFSSPVLMEQLRRQDPGHFNLIVGHLLNR